VRLSFERYLLRLARASALRSGCVDRKVGAVVVDARNVVVGTGYNGLARGLPNCDDDDPCPGRRRSRCAAVHAEVNALISAGHRAIGGTIATTCSPCIHCAGAIVNAGVVRVIVGELWKRHTEDLGTGWSPRDILHAAGIELVDMTGTRR